MSQIEGDCFIILYLIVTLRSLGLALYSLSFIGALHSVCHGTALVQMSFEVAFLHKAPVAMLAVKGLLAAMHSNVGPDAEDLGVCPWTL